MLLRINEWLAHTVRYFSVCIIEKRNNEKKRSLLSNARVLSASIHCMSDNPLFLFVLFHPVPPHLPSFFKLDFFKILRHQLYFSSSFFSLHEIIISAKTSNKCLQLLNYFNLNSFSKFRPPGLLRDPSQPPNLLLTAISPSSAPPAGHRSREGRGLPRGASDRQQRLHSVPVLQDGLRDPLYPRPDL